MYKLTDYDSVIRIADGACIPFTDGNRDYEGYKIWLSQGNVPQPAHTTEEILNTTKAAKLADIKAKLSATDYKRMKYDDGDLTAEEYEPIKVERHNLRSTYNAIEAATTIEEINNILGE